MSDLFAPFKSEETTGKLPKEMEEKISKAPEMSREELQKALEARCESRPTFRDVKGLIKKAAEEKEHELLIRLHKAAKTVAEPAISIFDNKEFTMAASSSVMYCNPRNSKELELLRSELDGLYGYFRRNACFHPVNGMTANRKRQKELRKKCPSISQIELRKDAHGHYRENVLIIAGLSDCPQSAFWMSFEF